MIELRDMQLLSALARHRHFAKAAEECGISQPAFSMRIRKFEDRLGVAVVRRGNRFQGLTGEGELLVARGRIILDEVRALEQEFKAARGEVVGTLVLGVVPTATAFAARLAVHLHSAYPRIVMRIVSASSLSIQQRLEEGTIDAGLTYGDSIGTDQVALETLYEESYVLFAPRAMVQGRGAGGTGGTGGTENTGITWAEAAELPLSLLEPGMQNRRILDRMFADLSLTPRVISETNGFIASMVMAREGLAATIVPQVLIAALGDLDGAVVLPLRAPDLSKVICLATPERAMEMPVVRALKEISRQVRDKKI
ncbi:MAG: LysR family transcriptional regulator [Rhodobacteraceae bacterium]|nr:LysR family transcriptional regulator [Paracoccaceae bacterium]